MGRAEKQIKHRHQHSIDHKRPGSRCSPPLQVGKTAGDIPIVWDDPGNFKPQEHQDRKFLLSWASFPQADEGIGDRCGRSGEMETGSRGNARCPLHVRKKKGNFHHNRWKCMLDYDIVVSNRLRAGRPAGALERGRQDEAFFISAFCRLWGQDHSSAGKKAHPGHSDRHRPVQSEVQALLCPRSDIGGPSL